jgi:tetratricopeptide (TPR) repeat protein
VVLIVMSLTGFAAVAAPRQGNPHLKTAVRLYKALEYDEALEVIEKAVKWPSNTPKDDVFLAVLEGILAFETQQPKRGEAAFRRALSIDLEVKPEVPLSPKVSDQLEQVRREVRASRAGKAVPSEFPPPRPTEAPSLAPAFGSPSPLRLPLAIGGGVVAIGGLLSWGRAKAIENQVRTADASISTKLQLEGSLQQGRTFETLGWVLMGVGAATASGSLLLLDAPSTGTSLTASPTPGGAQLFLYGSLP